MLVRYVTRSHTFLSMAKTEEAFYIYKKYVVVSLKGTPEIGRYPQKLSPISSAIRSNLREAL
jgi:hypothetical protein